MVWGQQPPTRPSKKSIKENKPFGSTNYLVQTTIAFVARLKVSIIPKWLAWFGYSTTIINFPAQAELFATIILSFPVLVVADFLRCI